MKNQFHLIKFVLFSFKNEKIPLYSIDVIRHILYT